MTATSKKNIWRTLSWLPGVLISLVALYLVFRKTNWQDLISAFSHLDIGILFAAIGLFLVSLGFRAFAWRSLLKNQVSFSQSFLTLNEGYLLNNVLPFRLGEIGRAIIMGKVANLGTFYVLSTIIMERIIDVTISASLLLAGLALATDLSSSRFIIVIILGIVILFFGILYLLSLKKQAIQNWIDKKSLVSPFVKKFIQKYSSDFLNGLEFFHSVKYFLPAVGFMIAAWALAFFEYYILLKGFIPSATLSWTALGLGALAFGVAIPSAPAYIGVFEGALVLALIPLAGESQKGSILAYALVIHITHFVLNGILGLVGFLVQRNSISGLLKDITRQKNTDEQLVEKTNG